MEINDPNEVPMAPPLLRRHEVEYPESDGKPMAETDYHLNLMAYLIDALRRRFRDDRAIYISGNNFVYYEEGNPSAVVSPDVYVVRGVPRGRRRTYKVWKEGKAPELVIELTSRSTHLEDLGNKRAIYEALGVKEYYIFDPEGDQFDPPFRAFRLQGGAMAPVAPRLTQDGAAVFRSDVVGLELHGRGTELRLVDPETGLALPTSLELASHVEDQERRIREERRRAEAQARQAAEGKLREAAERARAEAAEAELARLRQELERLRPR
jgi:Uma2 family endonuclease